LKTNSLGDKVYRTGEDQRGRAPVSHRIHVR
jgi:hypothetical protein